MESTDDILKKHGWRPGLWNDPFGRVYVPEMSREEKQRKKILRQQIRLSRRKHK